MELKDFNPLQFLEAKAHITEENKTPVENTLLGSKEALKLDSANYDVKLLGQIYILLYIQNIHYVIKEQMIMESYMTIQKSIEIYLK